MPMRVANRSCVETLATIDAMLAGHRHVTMDELSTACRCTSRSVRRHLKWMREVLGLSIVHTWDGKDTRYFYPHGQAPMFTGEIRQLLRGRVELEEVIR